MAGRMMKKSSSDQPDGRHQFIQCSARLHCRQSQGIAVANATQNTER